MKLMGKNAVLVALKPVVVTELVAYGLNTFSDCEEFVFHFSPLQIASAYRFR